MIFQTWHDAVMLMPQYKVNKKFRNSCQGTSLNLRRLHLCRKPFGTMLHMLHGETQILGRSAMLRLARLRARAAGALPRSEVNAGL